MFYSHVRWYFYIFFFICRSKLFLLKCELLYVVQCLNTPSIFPPDFTWTVAYYKLNDCNEYLLLTFFFLHLQSLIYKSSGPTKQSFNFPCCYLYSLKLHQKQPTHYLYNPLLASHSMTLISPSGPLHDFMFTFTHTFAIHSS